MYTADRDVCKTAHRSRQKGADHPSGDRARVSGLKATPGVLPTLRCPEDWAVISGPRDSGPYLRSRSDRTPQPGTTPTASRSEVKGERQE